MRIRSILVCALLLLISSVAVCGSNAVVDETSAAQSVKSEPSNNVHIDGADDTGFTTKEGWFYHQFRLSSIRFLSAFISSMSMIIVSEIGDKTFFIAAIMAMRHSRGEVFVSAMAALALMTVLSAAMGFTLPNILPPHLTHALATALFFFFGVKLLYDASKMDNGAPIDEMEEVEHELNNQSNDNDTAALLDLEKGTGGNKNKSAQVTGTDLSKTAPRLKTFLRKFFSPVFIQCFTMTFLAEWGDRSQIATIALAAAKDPYGVTFGGIMGHSICTGIAVIGGKLLATKISERTIAIVGGFLFLIFSLHSVLSGEI